MKISTKGRYGLRAMLDLAINSAGEQVKLKSVAQRQNISEGYLEQVFSTLRKGGLIKSIKGSQGGYILAKNPSCITVGEILRVLEGDLSVIDEKSGQDGENEIESCLNNNVWKRINDSINKTVDSITLEELIDEYEKLINVDSYMYYI